MWYLNLDADPRISSRVKGKVLHLTARDATDAERAEYWPKREPMYPDFVDYRARAGWSFTVILCDP
jgi:F420H(2)-dependent quinone reductase